METACIVNRPILTYCSCNFTSLYNVAKSSSHCETLHLLSRLKGVAPVTNTGALRYDDSAE